MFKEKRGANLPTPNFFPPKSPNSHIFFPNSHIFFTQISQLPYFFYPNLPTFFPISQLILVTVLSYFF